MIMTEHLHVTRLFISVIYLTFPVVAVAAGKRLWLCMSD